MSEGVIRHDVIQIDFDIQDNPIQKIVSEMNKLKEAITNIAGKDPFNDIADGAKNGAAGVAELSKSASSVASGMDEAKNSVTGVTARVGALVGEIKSVATQKIDNIKNEFSQFKSTVTEGKTGLDGFTTGVKNVAKISVTKLSDGFKGIKTSISNLAPFADKAKTKIKEIASTSMSKLKTGLGDIVKKLGEVGAKAASAAGNGIKNLAKGAGVALAAVGAGIMAVTVKALNLGGELEQSIGGVETLFKVDSGTVIENAKRAYLTAGTDAVSYMNQVTSFSASLLQSLGGDTAQAAKIADMSIIDMADNANKMGTAVEDIQNAYQGFAKQNYTMLDNLKLGYGGTKTEMERLLSDAKKLSGIEYDISNLSDVYQAIHVIQGELEITGTTAKEGMETLTGSLTTAKAAMSNFLSGAGSVDDMVDSLVNAGRVIFDRLIEIIPRLVSGVAEGIKALLPEVPGMLMELLPVLLDAAIQIVNGIIDILKNDTQPLIDLTIKIVTTIANFLLSSIPQLAMVGIQLLLGLVRGLTAQLPALIPAAVQAILTLCMGLVDALPFLIIAAIDVILALVDGIIKSLPLLLAQAPVIIKKLVNALVDAIPMIIDAAIMIIISLVEFILGNLDVIILAAIDIVISLAVGLVKAIPQLIAAVPKLIKALINTIMNTDWGQVGWDIINGIFGGLGQGAADLFGGVWDGITGLFGGGGEEAAVEGSNAMVQGFTDSAPTIDSVTKGLANQATDNLKPDMESIYGFGTQSNFAFSSGLEASSMMPISAADTVAMDTNFAFSGATDTTQYGADMMNNFAFGLDSNTGTAISAASYMSGQVESAASTTAMVSVQADSASLGAVQADVSATVNTATQTLETLPPATQQVMAGMKDAFTAGLNQVKALVTSAMSQIVSTVQNTSLFSAGMNMMEGFRLGLESKRSSIISSAQSIATAAKTAVDSALEIKSPSRALYRTGEFTGEGQILGMQSTLPKIRQTAHDMGMAAQETGRYTPEGDANNYSNTRNVEQNTFAPQFTMTINGDTSDRTMERKVKQWIKEGMESVFDGMSRRTPRPREV